MLPLVVHQLRRLLERALAQREGACRKGDAGQLSARRERVELREASGQLPQRVCQKSSTSGRPARISASVLVSPDSSSRRDCWDS